MCVGREGPEFVNHFGMNSISQYAYNTSAQVADGFSNEEGCNRWVRNKKNMPTDPDKTPFSEIFPSGTPPPS